MGSTALRSASFPPKPPSPPSIPEHNQATLDNIRLWDVHALQDTLRQVQEIRTYYDFPGIDIDRYQINGSLREVMLAVRELNVDKLPDEQPQLDQRQAHLHARLRHHHESGERLHARGPAHSLPEQHAGAEHGARPRASRARRFTSAS